jgi:hypothetical protein
MRRLADLADKYQVEMATAEGGNHTKVSLGPVAVTVPRHREINELTARGILRHVEAGLSDGGDRNA